MLESIKKLTELSTKTVRGVANICTVEASEGNVDEWTRRKIATILYDSVKIMLAEAFERGLVPEKLEELVKSKEFDDYLNFISIGIPDYNYLIFRFTGSYGNEKGTYLLDGAELSVLLIEENMERIPLLPNEKPEGDVEIDFKLGYRKFDKNSDARMIMEVKAPSFRWWEKNIVSRDVY